MKKLALLCMLSAFVLIPAPAMADWSENFDAYQSGSGLHGQGGWHGWDNDPTWDAYITNVQAHSSPNSVAITGPSDMVHEYTGYTSGVWVYTAWQYVPTNFSGTSYFLLLNTYANGGPYNWSTQISFNSAGYIQNDADGSQLPLITGRWVEIRVEIDLGADLQTFYYDNQMLFASSWVDGISGGGAVNIGAVDLFANNASPIYYDDLSLVVGGGTPAENTSWGSVKSLFR
jgi:hypothetical protein